MKFDELLEFSEQEHDRLIKHYNCKDNPKTKYTIFAKLVEEIGELSEAILTKDNLQRKDKLQNPKSTIGDELADVILATMLLARELNIDIDEELKQKIKKIKERKY
jgi:NTP pyrophosphatase (non-canonical NTP hydrolase)